MVSQQEIEEFLLGEDPEKYIVALEYDYTTSKIYKIIQDPEKGKLIKPDNFIPFAWVGDLHSKNFYGRDKYRQKQAMIEHGIIIVTQPDGLRISPRQGEQTSGKQDQHNCYFYFHCYKI